MVPSALAEPLATLAAGCIDRSASFIAEVFDENPVTVYECVYAAGHDFSSALTAAYRPEINLN